jgi:hypothetical protein
VRLVKVKGGAFEPGSSAEAVDSSQAIRMSDRRARYLHLGVKDEWLFGMDGCTGKRDFPPACMVLPNY